MKEITMTHPSAPADDHTSAYFGALQAETAKRLGDIAAAATRATFASAGFDWRPAATQAAIARRFRALPDTVDLTDAITQVICGTYDDLGFAHDPAAVRQAVGRHLGHGTLPPAQRP
jgi:hypothetical protein